MLGLWKKKKKDEPQAPSVEEIEKRLTEGLVKEIQASFLKANDDLMKAFASLDQITRSIETNQNAVAHLSESITILSQYYQSLDLRLRAIEELLTVNIVNFSSTKNIS